MTVGFNNGVPQVNLTGQIAGAGTSTNSTASVLTQFNALIGGAANAITSVAPSATSGVPLISQGAASNPAFGTAAIAGGGTNATSFTQSNGIVTYNGTSLVNYAGPQINSSGEQTNTTQPAFLAYLGSADANATGDATSYTLGGTTALTEVFDQGSDFNTNGTFTAPLTGRYFLKSQMFLTSLGAAHTLCNASLVTSNRTYSIASISPGAVRSSNNGYLVFGDEVADMDAADTATTTVVVSNSTKTVGIFGDASGSSVFSGYLIC